MEQKKNPTNKKNNGWIKHKNKSLKACQCKGSVHSYLAGECGSDGAKNEGEGGRRTEQLSKLLLLIIFWEVKFPDFSIINHI